MGHKPLMHSSRLRSFPDWIRDRDSWRFPATPDVKFLRSWLVYDSDLDPFGRKRRFDWNFLLGMAVVVSISAGFWAGIGMAIAGAR